MSTFRTQPHPAPPIEDQLLQAIISASFPPSPDSPLCTRNSTLSTSSPSSSNPKSEIPNPQSLASHFNLPLSKVLDILASPLTRSRLAAAQELRDLAFHQREQTAREKALAALESILDASEDPIEKRRAATAILRRNSTRNPFWSRTPGAAGASSLDEDEGDTPPRTPLPAPQSAAWCKPARTNLITLLTRLQDNHNPEPDSGLATLFLHKQRDYIPDSDQLREALDDYLEDPGQDADLTNFSCAILHNPEPATSNKAITERVTLHWPTHHRTIRFHFADTGNPIAALWQVAAIDIGPEETTPTDSS